MSHDEKLKSARGRPDIERDDDNALDPQLPPTGPIDTRPNPFTNRTWDEPAVEHDSAGYPGKVRMAPPPAPAPKSENPVPVWRDPEPVWSDPGQPGRISAAPQPGDPPWLVEIKDILRGALRASREVMRSGQAYAAISLCMPNDEEIEVVWEIGVGRLNATRGEGNKEGPMYETRDLWGRGSSLEDALTKAHTEKNPRGGRRG